MIDLLRRSGYDSEKIQFLQDGLTNGFDIGYRGPTDRQSISENIPFGDVSNEVILWNKIMKEVKLKRVTGPFENIPFTYFIQSPVRLVPKGNEGTDTRLIFHLSYDCKRDGHKSLNHHMPKDLCTVKYRDLDYVVKAYLRVCEAGGGRYSAGSGFLSRSQLEAKWRNNFQVHKDAKKVVYASKVDLKSAFRILGLSPASCRWLVFKARNPGTGRWLFFVDKCLPFGASISCALFQAFSGVLCHIFEYRTQTFNQVTNYLDDFLFLALCLLGCNELVESFLKLCEDLRIPVATDKTEFVDEIVTFLGILLDGRNFSLGIPLEKRDRAIHLLKTMIHKKKTTVHELQLLCGYLNFLGKAIFPGRTFTRRMYAKYSHILNFGGAPTHQAGYKLKKYHHVRLDAEFKSDCLVWLSFLEGNLSETVCRPMVDIANDGRDSHQIGFYSDGSGSELLGFGALLGNNWIQGVWGEQFMKDCKPSIAFLELYALVAGILTWQNHPALINCRVTVFCDNTSVVNMVNDMTSSCEQCMKLIRLLVLNGLRFNRRLNAQYLPSESNFLADTLSHGQWERFRSLGSKMNPFGDEINDTIWPVCKLWDMQITPENLSL